MSCHAPKSVQAGMLATLCLAAAAVHPGVATAASVTGTVRDAVTLDPVPGFNVTLHVIDPDSVALSTTSGPGGAYAISGAPDGNRIYVLTAHGPVYAGFYARLAVPDPEITFDVLLDSLQVPQPGEPFDSSAVAGRVMTTSGGVTLGVAGATVTLSAGGGSYVGVTDDDGGYSMKIPHDTYSAEVAAAGYLTLTDAGLEVDPGGLSYNAFLDLATTGTSPPFPGNAVAIRAIRPNPVRVATEIHYVVPRAGHVDLAAFDLAGREMVRIVSDWSEAGPHVATLSTARWPAGLYFCRLEAGGHAVSRKFAVLP